MPLERHIAKQYEAPLISLQRSYSDKSVFIPFKGHHGNFNHMSSKVRAWAIRIKRDGITLWFAGRHPRCPWYAKALGLFVVAYALSPIDLIPDFIPFLGYLDDVLLLPALIWLSIKLLPADVLMESRSQADDWITAKYSKPTSTVGAVLIVSLWFIVSYAAWVWFQDIP